MSTMLRHLEVMLVCEICEGEVDVESGSTGPDVTAPSVTAQSVTAQYVTAQCRHCGIAFAVDGPAVQRLSA